MWFCHSQALRFRSGDGVRFQMPPKIKIQELDPCVVLEEGECSNLHWATVPENIASDQCIDEEILDTQSFPWYASKMDSHDIVWASGVVYTCGGGICL